MWDEVQSGGCSKIRRKALKSLVVEIYALFLKEQDVNLLLPFVHQKSVI